MRAIGMSPSICLAVSALIFRGGLALILVKIENDTISIIFFFSESEVVEAQALYDFKARSSREVNFLKGDSIILFKQVSNDWWRGAVNGREGLIPDKYIMLKIR